MNENITKILEKLQNSPYSIDFCKCDEYIIKFDQNIPILWFSLTNKNEYFSLEKIKYTELNKLRKLFGLEPIPNPVYAIK